jgi:hypothetical protein
MTVKFTKFMVLAALAILLLILPGCSRDKQEPTAEKPQVTEKPDLPQEEVTSIKGKVLEVVDAGSFIFILLDRGEQQIWATVPAVDVKVGEEVTLLYANIFSNFHSKSMNRSFDELIFSSGIEGKSSGRRIATASQKEADQAHKPAADTPSAGQ